MGETPSLAPRAVQIAGRAYPVVPPSLRDPRLQIACALVLVQVLGQAALGFDLSIAQILVALATCAVLELTITFWRQRMISWPASALLTGNGVALILRVPGTEHGDWWSLRGAWIFAAVAAASLLSKYVIRSGGRPLFNPSNLGLVACFIALGPQRADPQDFWWGPMSPGLIATYLVIVVAGLVICSRLRLLSVAISFWTTFATVIGFLALSGHTITARWHLGPVSGGLFWWVLVTSPEILIFMFFMITDPKTAPTGRAARAVFAAGVAATAALLMTRPQTEFATKVAVLGGLTIMCALRPLLERLLPARPFPLDPAGIPITRPKTRQPAVSKRRAGVRVALRCVSVVSGIALTAVALIAAGALVPNTATRTAADSAPHARVAHQARLTPGRLPPVAIEPSVGTRATLNDSEAQRIGRDLVADLLTTGDALRRRDARLASAAGAAGGHWLDDLVRGVSHARKTGQVVVPRYAITLLSMRLLQRSASQATPEIQVRVQGTLTRATYQGSTPTPIREQDARLDKTFVMFWGMPRYWISSDNPSVSPL